MNNLQKKILGVDLTSRNGQVCMRLIYPQRQHLDVVMSTDHALALADALADTAREMKKSTRKNMR